MASYKHGDYAQTVMVPVSFEKQLLPGTLEFAIHELIHRRVDTSIFESRDKNDEIGCSAYDPKILRKVVLCAYARGLIASRQIERACHENITFMALACGMVPDHSTIAAFISSMTEEITSIFRDVLLVCVEQELLGGTHFALDGLKLPSHAAKAWRGTFDDLQHKREKLAGKVRQLLEQHETADNAGEESCSVACHSEPAKVQEQITR
jgi:transposase